MRISRREWLSLISATPLLHAAPDAPASPVAISRCTSYDDDVTGKLSVMFDQLGGIQLLVRGKTVTVTLNMTGPPSNKLRGMAPGRTHYNHPKVAGALAHLLGKAGARRIRFTESPWAWAGPLEEVMADSGWNVRELLSAAPGVEFENTNALCKRKKYARFKFPGQAYMYPEYVMSEAYAETDVFVSLAKLKQHADCGVTLSLKNCFGCIPSSIYGDDAGIDEPNEHPKQGRLGVVHYGRRQPAKIAPPELHPGASTSAGVRVSRVVADLAVVRPIHLAVIDGVESMAGGEGPWIRAGRPVSPGVLIAGMNPVCTDAVSTAVMGFNPRAARGEAPFYRGAENTLTLTESHGVGTTDLKRIEVRGVPIERAMYRFVG